MNASVKKLVTSLDLQPHPEGGYYRQLFESDQKVNLQGKEKSAATSIYYLLGKDDQSHFHVLASDEIWYYHQGGNAEIHMINPTNGQYTCERLGPDYGFQVVIPANTIFAARLMTNHDFVLVGCMVAPGFTFDEFRLCTKHELLSAYPQHSVIIKELAVD